MLARMMVERKDHVVLHEPYALPFYLGPERCAREYKGDQSDLRPEATFANTTASIVNAIEEADRKKISVFVKDMPSKLGPLLEPTFLTQFRSVMLVRHPAYAVPSFAKIWPNFTDWDVGFEAQHTAFLMIRDKEGVAPPVLDGTDLRANPVAGFRAFCHAVDIPFIPEAMTWDDGKCDVWGDQPFWDNFREDIHRSKGFQQMEPPSFPEVTERQARVIDSFRPLYETITADKLVINGN